MNMLSAGELLGAWERGLEDKPFERAMILLQKASPELSPDDLSQLSIGERDGRLLDLRASVFGDQLTLLAACPRCSQQLESVLPVSGLRSASGTARRDESTLAVGAYRVRFRPLNTADIAVCASEEIGALDLVRRCVVDATLDGSSIAASTLPDDVVGTIEAEMAGIDPGASINVDLTCPACEFRWSEPFDIVSYFWTEIDGWARRLLADVHALASSYGWAERDILGLSPVRRQLYLDLVYG